jgi:hypothetical protein
VAGEAERREQVMPQEQLLAQAPAHVPAEEPRRDEEHADAAGHEQIERPPHEVGVGALLLVEVVRIFAGHDAALAVGRVRDDQAERAAVARALLADPALEGHVMTSMSGRSARRIFELTFENSTAVHSSFLT